MTDNNINLDDDNKKSCIFCDQSYYDEDEKKISTIEDENNTIEDENITIEDENENNNNNNKDENNNNNNKDENITIEDENNNNKYENELCICNRCKFFGPLCNIKFSIQENEECCICLEEKRLLKLPTCIHKVCIQCCKTIYYGSTTIIPPTISLNDLEYPEWPYPFYCSNEEELKGTRKDWMIVDDKEFEYSDFRNEYLNYENQSYDELVAIRDSLISERVDWMNTEEFIDYENSVFFYQIVKKKIEKKWKKFNKTKTVGNGLCPMCRATP